MIRRFNYTGRHKIPLSCIEDISINEVLLDKTSQAGINEEKLLIKFSSLLSKNNHAILTIKKNNELIITDSLFLSKVSL